MQAHPTLNNRIDLPHWLASTLVIALLLGAWFIRINRLAIIPPGMESDTTYDLAEGVRIMRGVPLPLAFDTRPEPAHRFMLGAWFWLTGPHMFTARMLQVNLGLLTVAMVYRATRILLRGRDFGRLGALIAAGALAAMVAHLFLSRTHYRVILTPLVIATAAAAMLRAVQTQRGGRWAWSGAASGLGLHTYIAGTMTPLWFLGFLAHQMLFPAGTRRAALKHTALGLLGLLIPAIPWLLLALTIPDLYSRVSDVAPTTGLSITTRLATGLIEAARAFYAVGYYHPLYNTDNTPFLNPALAALALAGLLQAVWRWRRPEGALLLGGLLIFMLPGALSREPTHSTRLVGTMPVLALLAGWGAAWIGSLAVRASHRAALPRRAVIAGLALAAAALLGGSLAGARAAYFAHFADPERYAEPGHWLNIPHNYTLAYTEALSRLAEIDGPTYVPVWALDTPAAGFVIQREAFPHVTTWVRYGLTELPEGQLFYPTFGYYHNPAPTEDFLMALLLPDEDLIVLLPPSPDGASVIQMPGEGESTELWDSEGRWPIARVGRREASALPEFNLDVQPDTPLFGEGLHLVDVRAPADLHPGEDVTATFLWAVAGPQRPGVSSVAQLVSLDSMQAVAWSEGFVLHGLYPSALWQPGDVIPNTYRLHVPDDQGEGVYFWGVAAYAPPGQKRLALTPAEIESPISEMWFWETVRIPPPEIGAPLPDDATPLDARFEDHIRLEGYRLAQQGEMWRVELFWRADGQPAGEYTIFLHAMRGAEIAAQQDIRPQNGRLPTWAWRPGELIVTTHDLFWTPGTPAPEALYAGLYPSTQIRLAVEQDGVEVEDGRALVYEGR